MKKRTVALLLTMMLAIGCGIGGTLAWLLDVDGEVKNTFTISDVDISLTETDSADDDTDAQENTYKMIPGHEITKDPTVTVKANSEPCYVFVKVEKTGGKVTVTKSGNSVEKSFEDFIVYAMADGWIQGRADERTEGGVKGIPTNVYYREITSIPAADNSFVVIGNKGLDGTWKPNVVLVKPTVTKDMMQAVNEKNQEPKLNFYAYASQLYETNGKKFDVGDAWDLVENLKPAAVTP